MFQPLRVTVPEPQWLDLWPQGHECGSCPCASVQLRVWDMTHPLSPDDHGMPGADVVVLPYVDAPKYAHQLSTVPGLRWAQTLTAGYDGLLEHLPSGVGLARGESIHDTSTAELAVGLAIASRRGIAQAAQDAIRRQWAHQYRPALADSRVLIIGAGAIGNAIADRLAPFEVSVTRVGRSARYDERGAVESIADLHELLPRHDIVIVICPLTSETHHLIGGKELAALPDGSLVINVARGPVVDSVALMAELSAQRLHAALDVFDPEPVPPEHPVWDCPNLVLTPHIGGNTSAMVPRAMRFMRLQLEKMSMGQGVRSVIVAPKLKRIETL